VETNPESQNLEDNLPMVNYIMLHRIYDLLTLIASEIVKDSDKVNKMVQYHEAGYLLGPGPSYTPQENQES
jgi:hypothetical protein